MGDPVRVIARGLARKGGEAETLAAVEALVEPTRKEAGCVRYEVLAGLDDPREVAVVEEWASAEALQAHLASPHVQAFFARAASLFDGAPSIVRYRLAR